jgi:protein SCO1
VRSRRIGRRGAAAVVVAAAALGALLGLGAHRLAGGSSGGGRPAAEVHGQAVWPAGLRRAPGFSLRDQSGRRLSLADLRGRPAILAFMDSHCHQECPLEGRALAAGFRTVPSAERPVVVVVGINPWEDTPASARRAMKRFGLAGFRWHWLLGSVAALKPVWRRYGIEVRRAKGDVEHTAAIYLIDARGFERAGMVYPFLPVWIGDDLRALAADGP